MPWAGVGTWELGDSFVDFFGNGDDHSISFMLKDPTLVKIEAHNGARMSDEFSLILDDVPIPWTIVYTDNDFYGAFIGLLEDGLHSFSLVITKDCCGNFEMGWNVSAVPESETYLMLLAGLGLLSFMVRYKKYSIV